MLRRLLVFVVASNFLAFTPAGSAGDFPGWQALRVIEQDGAPSRMLTADLDGDGRDEIVVVNLRNARLDVYAWKSEAHTEDSEEATDHVNDLPMAPEVARTEVPLRQPPIDVAPRAWGPEGVTQLFVLVSNPNKLLRVGFSSEEDKWVAEQSWDLLPGRYAGSGSLLQFVGDDPQQALTVLVSCFDGIQELTLQPGDTNRRARARWLEPRESINRNGWWLADLDGDGHDDLVEWTNDSAQSLRWYPAPGSAAAPGSLSSGKSQASGTAAAAPGFRPAQTLHDRSVSDVTILDQPAGSPDELLILENQPEGAVRRYRLSAGEMSELGKHEPLALAGGDGAVWASGFLADSPSLVLVDPGQPRVTLYTHDASGWRPGESFPIIGKIKAMAEPQHGERSTLLLWPADSGDLYAATWNGERLSFPQPVGLAADAKERRVIGFGRVGNIVWCIQTADDDLLLHRWADLPLDIGRSADGDAGQQTWLYPNASGKAEDANWVGGTTLLVADKFAKGLRRVDLADKAEAEAVSIQPAHLAKAKLTEFRVFGAPEGLRVGRFTDGVVQWLNNDLVAIDQVMLPDGQRLADLALLDDGSAWALQQGGNAIHRLLPDDAGVLRVDSTTRVEGGRSLIHDPHFGLLMVTAQGITRLSEGEPLELEVVQSLDARTGKPAGVRDATVHRVMSLDIDGDGRDDALLADDTRHQLTALGQADESGDLSSRISWPVFEDQSYPYGGQGEELVREPRRVSALDLDGDGQQDLAMLSHDRLVIYLANEPHETTGASNASEENQHD